MPKLSVTDQLKVIRGEIDDINYSVGSIKIKMELYSDQFSLVRTEIKDIGRKLDQQEQKFEKWRSDIHNLIDKGFTSKAKKLERAVFAKTL